MSNTLLLTANAFSQRRWRRFTDFAHTAHWNRIPITAPEAVTLGSELPLFFSATGSEHCELIVLTGLQDGRNDLLDEKSRWRTGYQPALVRCAPFRLLSLDQERSKKAVCVDLETGLVEDQTPGEEIPAGYEPFFVAGQPQPSEAVQKTIEFLKELEQHRFKTQRAVDQLFAANLLQPVTHAKLQELPGLLTIDEKRFNQLSDADFIQLRASGALALAYVQLLSAHQLPRLINWSNQSSSSTPGDLDLDQFFGEAEDDMFRF